LDADASMALAEAMGLVDPKTKAAMDSLSYLRQQLADGKITIEEYTERVARMKSEIEGLKNKTITITLMTNYSEGNIATAEVYAGHDLNGNGIIGRAGGGPASGLTWVGEQGPELVKLPPGSQVYSGTRSNQIMQGGVASIEIDYKRMARAFAEELQKVSR